MEKKLLKINESKNINRFIFVFIFILWFILTMLYPIISDDETWVGTITNDISLIERIKQIYISQKNGYLTANGRILSHTLLQIMLNQNKIIFDIFNAIVFTILCFSIYDFRKNKKTNNVLLLIIFLSLWFFPGDTARGEVWASGALNYLFGAMLNVSLIKNLYVSEEEKQKKDKFVKIFLILILAFLSTSVHEIIVLTSGFCIYSYMFIKILQKKKIYKYEIYISVLFFIGACITIFAPANFSKITQTGTYNHNILYRFIFAFVRDTYYLLIYTTPLINLTIITIIKNYLETTDKKQIFYQIILLLVSCFGVCFLLSYATSCLIVPVVCMLILISYNFEYLKIENNIKLIFVSIMMMFILFITEYLFVCVFLARNIDIGDSFNIFMKILFFYGH